MNTIAHTRRHRLCIAALAILTLSAEASSRSPESTTEHRLDSSRTTSKGDYGRHIINERPSPYSAIGKLAGALTCTGAIVLHPRIVLTASHCITGIMRHSVHGTLTFQLAHQTASSSSAFNGRLWAMGAIQHRDWQTVHEASEDWAIVLLEGRPRGIRPLRVSNYSVQQLISHQGQLLLPRYSFDIAKAELLGLGPPCSIRGEAWGVLLHDCAAAAGASGAPLLMKDDVWHAVVGVHSGSMYVDDDDNHSLRPLGKSAIRIDRFAGSLRELLRKLDAEDDTDRVHSPAY